MKYLMHPPSLINSVITGDLIPFVGAGLSVPCGGKSWSFLVEQMLKELGKDIGFEGTLNEVSTLLQSLPNIRPNLVNELKNLVQNSLDPLMLAQIYENNFGRRRLINFLAEHHRNLTNPSLAHDLLVSLNCKLFVTTNYDNLIERSLNKIGSYYRTIAKEEDIAYWSSQDIRVIRMHGSLVSPFDPDSVIFSRSDYEAFPLTHPNMDMLLQFLMSTGTLLLIGYSARDPNFLAVHDRVRHCLKQHKRQAYFVTFDLPEAVQDYWAEYNLYPINLPGTDKQSALQTWLMELIEKVKSRSLT